MSASLPPSRRLDAPNAQTPLPEEHDDDEARDSYAVPRRCVATAGVLALVLIAGALPARAEVINHQRFTDSFSDDFELCGIPVHSDGEESGFFLQRVGTGDLDSLFFVHINVTTTETITNPANGKFLVIESHEVIQETRAVRSRARSSRSAMSRPASPSCSGT